MTEGEKRCGLGSFLPISCRGRAEAFARRLHNRLRSLGSQDGGDGHSSEISWLANNEITGSVVTNLQPRHSVTENDIFMDFAAFDTPGSPEEELAEHELTKFVTNPKDDLHNLNLDECGCISSSANSSCKNPKRNSLDSDSSDCQYFDTETNGLQQILPQTNYITSHSNTNGVSMENGMHHHKEDISRTTETNPVCKSLSLDKSQTLDEPDAPHESKERIENYIPSPSDCTLSSLSQYVSEEEPLDDSPFKEALVEPLSEIETTPDWCLNFEPNDVSSTNNNIYSAIDLESLQECINEDIESENIPIMQNTDSSSESYCSHLEISNDLTIVCPSTSDYNLVSPVVEVSTLEIIDTDLCQEEENSCKDCKVEEKQTTVEEVLADLNHLQVMESNHDDDIELEERIPRVRRCSSLKTGKTPPGTPGRKKIVRFADVLGLDLADVRTFLDEIPKVPISAYDDLSGADLTLSDTSLSSSSCLESINASDKTLLPLFQQPGGETNFMDRIRNNQVCLENTVVKDSIALCVCGTVRVINLDFNKSVHVRYSIDQWKSFADLQATYVDNSCDGFSDKFSFTLYVHTLTVGQRLEFAVRFQCKGCQYWDNNDGVNYCFECLPATANTSYVPITKPDDATWAGAAFY